VDRLKAFLEIGSSELPREGLGYFLSAVTATVFPLSTSKMIKMRITRRALLHPFFFARRRSCFFLLLSLIRYL